jgi:RNA-binding protein YlmH
MKPVLEKFSDDFSHRDFLGALMNLGIERSTIGDILVGEREGFLFCLSSIAEYICGNLLKVRHTNIKCRITEDMANIPEEQQQLKDILVSSERADVFLAKAYNKSRSEALALFGSAKVYINGRLCQDHARQLKVDDTVNVRGYGKFVFASRKHESKKGKLYVQIAIFR